MHQVENHTTASNTAALVQNRSTFSTRVIDGEPRMIDLRIAEALGFDRTRNIRKLIERHRESLENWGSLHVEQTSPTAKGGRPGKAYWLNRKQALFITAKSDTESAAMVTIQMVEVFDAATAGASVPVKAHTRRKPKAIPAAPEVPALPFDLSRDGIGVIRMGGKLYLFDAVAGLPRDGEPVLAIVPERTGQTPRLEVFEAEAKPDLFRDQPHGARTSLMVEGKNRFTGGVTMRYCTTVGRVLAVAQPMPPASRGAAALQ